MRRIDAMVNLQSKVDGFLAYI